LEKEDIFLPADSSFKLSFIVIELEKNIQIAYIYMQCLSKSDLTHCKFRASVYI